jgi:hypothetical protein
MTLPSSGALSILDIVGEFGGGGSHSLTEYYRGGTFVPNTPANSGIPTSGAISILDFYGAAASTSEVISVTIGVATTKTTTTYGYNDASETGFSEPAVDIGARSPTTVNGATIYRIANSFTSVFNVILSGSRAQSFFTSIDIQTTSGSIINRTSASASYSTASSPTRTQWSWATTTAWTSTSPSPRTVTFNF